MKKKTYSVTGMHCTSCAMVIESDLEDIGVQATCNYAKQTLDVTFDEKLVSEEKIQDTVLSSGYAIVSK